jgi:hypothetical protein
MATKLVCPQCRQEMPATNGRGAASACPKCQAGANAPKSPKTKAPKSTVVLQSLPYQPPPAASRLRSPRWLIYSGTAVLLLALVVGFFVWRRPAQPGTEYGVASSAAPASPTAPKPSKSDDVSLDLTPQSTTGPRVPPTPKIDPTPNQPAPFALSPAAKTFPSSVDADKVENAIRRGRDFLIANKNRWLNVGSHDIGYAAFVGLALYEVGVPGNDPALIEAAALVRKRAPKSEDTYDIALAILFLDRLGAASDDTLIRSLALRILAGQTSQYGWGYHCPRLPSELETPLQTVLEKLQPEGRWQAPLARESGQGLVSLAIPLEDRSDGSRQAAPEPERREAPEKNLVRPITIDHDDRAGNLVKDFPPALRSLPVVQPMDKPISVEPKKKGKAKNKAVVGHLDDNSNTQFALLALWAARRHGLPVDRSLLLSDQRFAQSQLGDGSWAYRLGDGSQRPPMTCVGLLGLALGHGALLPEERDVNRPASRVGADVAIKRGLEALGRSVGVPQKRENAPTPNLYFLWSVERVAMIYQLPTIGGKDWYGWGANDLIASQRQDGAWSGSEYHGSSPPLDTAFALLFLRRSNLVPDLTERLQLHMAISDPQKH